MTDFHTDIVLGKTYRDEPTGIVGRAVSIHFYEYACERVVLEYVSEGKLEELSFDVPRIVDIESGVQARTERPGGPARSLGRR